MIGFGNTEITKAYLGDTEISKMYLGDELVFGGSPTPILPYDAEIEYLQSDGHQFIDTGLTTSYGRAFQQKIQQTSTSGNKIIGTGGINSTLIYSIRFYESGIYFNVNGNLENLQSVDTAVHTFKIDVPNLTAQFDNTTQTITGSMSYTNRNYKEALYAYSQTGNLSPRNSYNFVGRIFWAKYWEAGELVRDFIPVRVGQVGYMYDNVSGQLFGNDGTGNFILGPDKT